tara:strand:+ start:662 stop:2383 length:1722 start_codon:yes stop_codon:yes gene_type:complete
MPNEEGELTDEDLEVVVGGASNIKYILEGWRRHINEEENVKVPAVIRPKQELNQDIWDGERLKPDIRDKLLEIAKKFIEPTRAADAELKDITFTGSLANYNYSDLSDIDLHILIDFKDVNEDTELVRRYFNAVKALWNYVHDIRIKGYEVEAYVQDDSEPHTSTGVYSVLNDEWITKPSYREIEVDEEAISVKADSLMDQIDIAIELSEQGKHEEALERGEMITDKLKKLRKSGLKSAGEYSVENLAFKSLRNQGYLTKLSDLKRDAYDAMMSVDEKKKKKKKKKGDRCTRIAKRKYDVWPSAYASGAVVKCRQGKIWKGLKEDDVRDTYDSEVVNKNIASRKKGSKAFLQTEEGIDEKTDYSKEKDSGLHGWFSRQGGKGKSKGWVDCNTCRKDKKTGRKKCKACGRKKGEKRAKYPACRPTPAACGTRGKGKKWGKKSEGAGQMDLSIDTLKEIIMDEFGKIAETYFHITDATYDDGTVAENIEFWDDVIEEAEYRGRKVKLNKPTRGDVKKFKVYVKDPKTGNVKKVNFGDPNMRIRKSNPARRKSFRARHNCDNPGPKTKARYWSCRKW